MLLALLSAFALSQAYRTVTAIMATGLQNDFGLTPASLGAFAGLFGLSFGVTQFFMGIGMDVVGLRRTVLSAFPLTIVGAALSAWAPDYPWLMLGQLLIGVGCAPAFLACTVFIARHFPSARFAFVSGIAMGVGGLGLLFTGTPLAWLVQRAGWRSGFVLLAVLSALAWLLIWRRVHEPALAGPAPEREHWSTAVRRFGALFVLPHTLGILLVGMVAYASFLALRGLWIGPMLIERYGFTLVDAGNMAVAMSLISLFSPALFGRIDPGPTRRRRWVVNFLARYLGAVPGRGPGSQRGAEPGAGAGHLGALGLWGAAVFRCALVLPTGPDRPGAVALHHGHVSGRGADAVAHGMGGRLGASPRGRALPRRDDHDCRCAGAGLDGVSLPAGVAAAAPAECGANEKLV